MSARFHWNEWTITSEPTYALPEQPAVVVTATRTMVRLGGKVTRRRVTLRGGNRLMAKDTATAMDETVLRMLAVLEEKDRPEAATRRIA